MATNIRLWDMSACSGCFFDLLFAPVPVEVKLLAPISRSAPRSVVDRRAKLGMAKVDVKPPPGFDLSGYSLAGRESIGLATPLSMCAVYFEDPAGNAAAWVVGDLHSATRYMHEKAASLTATRTPIGVDNLIFCGTHTHTGPGQFYGNSLYDLVTTRCALTTRQGFQIGIANHFSAAIARAVVLAHDDAQRRYGAISVGFGESLVWTGDTEPYQPICHNRSLDAFRRNPESAQWSTLVGAGAPGSLSDDQRSIDPRVRACTFYRDDHVAAVVSSFGCHSTALGCDYDRYNSDWPGHARTEARRLLEDAGDKAMVAVALSGAGDVNTLTGSVAPGEANAYRVGRAIGRAIFRAVAASRASKQPLDRLEARFIEVPTSEKVLTGTSGPLAANWAFGKPTLGGSEESKTPFYSEGETADDFKTRDPPQHPKVSANWVFGVILPLLFARLEPSPILALRTLRIGSHLLVGVPFEPTSTAAHRIESALKATANAQPWVLGYSSDYNGYLTTPEEFEAQHYEGASTIWGKHTLSHIIERFRLLIEGAKPATDHAASVSFETVVPDDMSAINW